MSRLNHAFLRAYAKDQPSPRAASSSLAPPEPSDMAAEAPMASPARPSSVAAASATSAAGSPVSAAVAPSGSAGTAVVERTRIQVDHPLYAPRHDVPLPTRPLFAARTPAAPAVQLPPPPIETPPPSVASSSNSHAYAGPPRGYEAIEQRGAPRNGLRVDGPHETPKPLSRTRLAPRELVPAWEVDAFQWPRSCEIAWDGAREEFDSLGEELVQVNAHGLRVLGVTSAAAHEGRTTLTMCLARAAAEQGLRVALLDADLENPQLAPVLGVDVRHDWTEVISEALPIEEAAVSSITDRLTLVPLLAGAAGRANLLRLPQFQQFVAELSESCDLVIVDLPPLDSKALPTARPGHASPLDAVLLVRDVRQTTVEQLREARRRLDASGLPTVGVIENFV